MVAIAYNPGLIWNKANPDLLPDETKRQARKEVGIPFGLPSGAVLVFNPVIDGEVAAGYWVKSYASGGHDSKPYCVGGAS